MSGSDAEPSPPTVKAVVSASVQLFTGASRQVTQVLTSSVPLPSQLNLRESNCVLLAPISGSIAMPREKVPMTEPSLGAALYRKLAARRLPAPAMFCGTIVGLPGICRPR